MDCDRVALGEMSTDVAIMSVLWQLAAGEWWVTAGDRKPHAGGTDGQPRGQIEVQFLETFPTRKEGGGGSV